MDKLEEWRQVFGHTRVIVRSNEREDFLVGDLEGFFKIADHHKDVYPHVRHDGKLYACFGIVVPWTAEMEEFLTSLSPARQWAILSGLSLAIQINRRRSE